MRKILAGLGSLALVASLAVTAGGLGAADHLEAPFVQRDGRTDINDIYAFQSPSNPNNTVLIMTVNPLAGVVSGTTFDRDARYQLRVDVNDDNLEDAVVGVRFGTPRANGRQRVKLTLNGETLLRGATGTPISGGGVTLMAGTFDDPFFFDLQAFLDQVKGQGGSRTFCDGDEVDFFAGANVSAIVIEVPNAVLGGPVKAWAETRIGRTIVDRMAIPAIGTVLIADGLEDAHNATHPSQHARFWQADIRDAMLGLSGLDGTPYTEAEAQAIAEVLSPDVVPYDPSNSAGFAALNGRHLDDDVIDGALAIVTGGFFGGSAVLDSDCVDANDVPFRASFPYLAEAH